MSTLATVCRHEWRLLRTDRAWPVALLLFTSFVAYASYTGAVWARQRQDVGNEALAKRDALRQEQRASLLKPSLGSPPPASMPYTPRDTAVLAPTPLAALSVGQSDLLPHASELRLFTAASNLFAPYATDSPAVLAGGRFDLAFVLVFLFPLLLLAFTYNLLSAEREQGTLSLTLAEPVSARTLVLGKTLVRGTALVLPVVVLVGVALVLTGRPLSLGTEGLWLSLLALLIVGYAAFWLALAAMVNAYSHNSSANALLLGGVWLGVAVVVPALANLLGQVAYPLPSRPEMVNEARLALVEADKRGTQVLGTLYQLHPELRPASQQTGPIDEGTRQYYAVQQAAEAESTPRLQRFDAAVQQRERFIEGLRYLSPSAVLQGALNEIAGTSTARHRAFQRQVTAHLIRWRETFAPRLFQGALLTANDYGRLPHFAFQEEPIGARLARLMLALAGLLVPTVLLGALATSRLRRYRLAE